MALYALRDFGTPSLMRFNSFTRAIFTQYRASFNLNRDVLVKETVSEFGSDKCAVRESLSFNFLLM